jgi:threonine synthase
MGGILADKMGLPVSRFIISTNRNDEVPEYLRSGLYKIISPSFNCISSAMNVGHPSNLARIIAMYGGEMNEKGKILREPELEKMRSDFFGISISDGETRKTIAECYKKYGMLLEPHGAVAWGGLESYHEQQSPEATGDDIFISLETAHPAKFADEIISILGFTPPVPPSLAGITEKREEYIELDNDYGQLKGYFLKHLK